jgi:hypothetical protein
MGGSRTSNYITGGLQTAIGAGLMFVPGAQAFAIPLMTAGAGQLIGTGAGGTKGGTYGEMAGLAAGGLGEGLAGLGPLGGTRMAGWGANLGIPQLGGGTGAAEAAAALQPQTTEQQVQRLAQAGFPGAQQMQGVPLPPGGGQLPNPYAPGGTGSALISGGPAPPPAAGAAAAPSTLQQLGQVGQTLTGAAAVKGLVEPPQAPQQQPPPPFSSAQQTQQQTTQPTAPSPLSPPAVTQVPQSRFAGGPAPMSPAMMPQMDPNYLMMQRIRQLLGGGSQF